MPPLHLGLSPLERLLRSCSPEPNSGCWLWAGQYQCGPKPTDLRPRVSFYGRNTYAYRAMWELTFGPVPAGMHVCHRCDVPMCCNPDHLFLGTRKENMADCVAKGRTNKPRGADTYKAKLTDADVIAIRASSAPHKHIARVYGVDNKTIRSLRKRLTWRHVQ